MERIKLLLIAVALLRTEIVQSQSQGEIETRKYYRIESHDGSVLSVAGGNSGGVKIFTEDAQGLSNPRQKFWVGRGETHEIQPEMQNAFSNLVLDLDLSSSLLFQQVRNFRRHQWWKITNFDTKSNKWVIQNDRTGQCLATRGKDTQVFGTICDLSSGNQTWTFHRFTL